MGSNSYQTIVEAEAPVERCLHPLEVLQELLLRAAGHGDADDEDEAL